MLFGLGTPVFLVAEGPGASAKLILTSHEHGTEPESSFSCSGTIYGYLVFPDSKVGKHVLEGIWTGPSDRTVQHSRDEVNFPPPGKQVVAVWFQFKRDEGGLFDPTPSQEAADENHRLYGGSWQTEVRWDGRSVASSNFTVNCPR